MAQEKKLNMVLPYDYRIGNITKQAVAFCEKHGLEIIGIVTTPQADYLIYS